MARKKRKINWKKIKWGSLTRWLRKHRSEIKKKYGDPFRKNPRGKDIINDNVLRKLAKDKKFLKELAGPKWEHILRKIRYKLNVLRG